tara:strand:- start:189 stop:404 length:216 start_codon:yes stop_codon:yes gene_type:complete
MYLYPQITRDRAFAVGGLVYVSLRKLEKTGEDTATLVDDDLRVLVRKLRDGQGRQEELIQNLLKKPGDHQA